VTQVEAEAAARAANVRVRLLSDMDEHVALAALLDQIWQVPHPSQVLEPGTLRALAFSGNYVAGAYHDDELVAGSVAFMTPDGHLHSHVAGVAPGWRGKGLGYAVKLHQRAWALRHQVESVQWTFDPAQRRNARFNLQRLGATVTALLPDFYGAMIDGLNADAGPSDRLLVDWQLNSPRVHAALSSGLAEPDAGLAIPIGTRDDLLRRLAEALETGHRISGITSDGRYTLEKTP
jgi:predicted GNAT superfamily acetyltransferase